MWDEECPLDGASVGVDQVVGEHAVVDVDVVNVHGTVESQSDHLGNLRHLKFARDLKDERQYMFNVLTFYKVSSDKDILHCDKD